MSTDTYTVMLDNGIVANGMPLEFACLLAQSLFEKYYNDNSITVQIVREKRKRGENEEA